MSLSFVLQNNLNLQKTINFSITELILCLWMEIRQKLDRNDWIIMNHPQR